MCYLVSFGCGVVSVSTLFSLLRIPVVSCLVGCFCRCGTSSPVTTTTRSSLLAASFSPSIVISSCRLSREAC